MAPTVLITGAAGGVGQATAHLFLEHGWQVIATARQRQKLDALADHPGVTALELDVADPASIDAAVAAAMALHPEGIDALVNNAGIGIGGPLEAVSDSDLREIFATNLFGVAGMIRAVLPHMRARQDGTIINVGSISGRVGIPYLSPYVASKFALEGLSETLQYELSQHGIRVKLIEPGGIKTTFSHRWLSVPAYEPQASKVDAMMSAGLESARPPEEVANTILRAVNDRSPRLRYSSNGGAPLLLLRRLLSDRAMTGLLGRRFLGR